MAAALAVESAAPGPRGREQALPATTAAAGATTAAAPDRAGQAREPGGAAERRPAGTARAAGPVLTVRETAGVARQGEVLRSGIPLPRVLDVRATSQLAVVDAAGRPVPADFRVLARWNAGLADEGSPIQWVLVAFPATVPANGSATYRLAVDGPANPAPPRPLTLRREGNRVTIDTGAAVFTLGGDGSALFERVALPDGKALVTGGLLTAAIGGSAVDGSAPEKTVRHARVRRLEVEHAGPLSAAVVLDGAYGMEPVGNGGLGSRRRYLFAAGSPTALVTQSVAWEGNLACNGCVRSKEGAVNGLRLDRVRDTLAVDLGARDGLAVTAVGAAGEPALAGALAPGKEAWVRQRQRGRREDALAFDVRAGDVTASGRKADGGLLAASGPAGTVALALDHMHRYEPQALRVLAGGELAADLADDHVWLAHHQGLFATLAVAALPGRPGREELDRGVWAPLNHPLRAWPDAAWFTASEAVDEVPVGKLSGRLAGYDGTVSAILERTLDAVDEEGIAGLMTFGLYPRYWGKWGSPELSCSKGKGGGGRTALLQGKGGKAGDGADPTPEDDWDDIFWCGSWTDYHNTTATAAVWAMRSGEVRWLDEISWPAARRMLYTQVQQCVPGDSWFYCGQSPAGYGGYRKDFNSSHAYFENLLLYYWLSGDSTVVDVLRRGAESMRRRVCDLRGPVEEAGTASGPGGPACPPDHALGKGSFAGRVGSQWVAVFRFVGLASEDASFLEDYRGGLARAVTLQYAELTRDGKRYGFLGDAVERGRGVAGPVWTNGFYDAHNLYRLERDTGDAALGIPPVRPSHVIAAMARTLVDLEDEVVAQQGKRRGFPRLLGYTFDGDRIGGVLTGTFVPPKEARPLYNPERAGLTAFLVRAGRDSHDPALLRAGAEMVRMSLGAAAAEKLPLGKLQGQYLTRLHPSVALLAGREGEERGP